MKVMYLHGHGPGLLHTKKPVMKLEDVKGMKIRASGSITRIVYALGGSPVGTTMPETYDALRTGVADGALAPYEALYGFKWGEVVSTTECYPISYTDVEFIVMNKDKWNALPPDIQKIIEKINEEWIEKQGKAWDEIDKEGKEFVIKRGNKIQTLSAQEGARWKTTVQPLIDDYVKTNKAKGLPAEAAVKFVQDYLKGEPEIAINGPFEGFGAGAKGFSGGIMGGLFRTVEKLGKLMQVVSGIALTFIMLLTVTDVAGRLFGHPWTARSSLSGWAGP